MKGSGRRITPTLRAKVAVLICLSVITAVVAAGLALWLVRDGKRTVDTLYRETMVPLEHLQRVQEFLRTFDARNLTNDAELRAVVEQARYIFGQRTDEELRNSPAARTAIKIGFEDVRESLTKMLETKPTRRIRLADEPVA